MVLVGEALGPGLYLGFELEHLVDRHRQVAQPVEVGAFLFRGEFLFDLGHDQGEQEQGGELGSEGLGRSDANLGSSAGDEAQGAFADVADGQGLGLPQGFGVAQRGQCVGDLAGLGSGDDQLFRVG